MSNLTNVTVVNDQPASNTLVLGPITLAPGQSVTFTNSYIVRFDFCGPYTDTLTASGFEICGGSNLIATATAACPGLGTPAIVVTKLCPETPVQPGGLLVFSGIVSNSGNTLLTNVLVFNDRSTNKSFDVACSAGNL